MNKLSEKHNYDVIRAENEKEDFRQLKFHLYEYIALAFACGILVSIIGIYIYQLLNNFFSFERG